MVKTFFTILLSTLIISPLNAQWEIMNEHLGYSLTSIDFINDDVGWIGGTEGTLLKTVDGGENWEVIYVSNIGNIKMIDFLNESIGWAISGEGLNDGRIFKTENGGNDWTVQKEISDLLASLFVLDEEYVYAAGAKGAILKTTDGGLNWIDIHTDQDFDLTSIRFLDKDNGIIVGFKPWQEGIIIRTTDGGLEWGESLISDFLYITALHFKSDSTFYFLACDFENYFLCKSIDYCQSWEVITQRPYSINSYQFQNDTIVYSTMHSPEGKFMKSTDGGVNWVVVSTFENYGPDFFLNKIFFTPSGNSFLITHQINNGLGPTFLNWNGIPFLFKRENGKTEWKLQKFSYPTGDIYFIDQSRGFLTGGFGGEHVAYTGSIFSTEDASSTWDPSLTINGIINSISFVTRDIGFISSSQDGGYTYIYKTTDSGFNWDLICEFTFDTIFFQSTLTMSEISFIDLETGWIVGRNDNFEYPDSSGAVIIRTSDSGINWVLDWKYVDELPYTYKLNSICIVNGLGFSVGDGGMIVKYNNNEGWELQSFLTDLPLKKVFFYNENSGWISGGYLNNNGFQKILLRTTNAGDTWNMNQKIPYLINDIFFTDFDHGWAVGNDENDKGVILYTDNGGDQWYVQVEDLEEPMVSLCLLDEYGWAVGSSGMILNTTDNGVVWVDEKNNKTYPTEFMVEQNYPNPFNPTTTIKYQIPNRSFVTLKIYDVLSNEIETIVNEEQTQGVYEIEYDGSKLSSGVYLYNLETDTNSETRKMVLIK